MKPRERSSASQEVKFQTRYEVDLARGASHIASMLYADSIKSALLETLRAFEKQHGRGDYRIFMSALAQRLENRDRAHAVAMLRYLIEHDDLDGFVSSAPASGRPTLAPPSRTQTELQSDGSDDGALKTSLASAKPARPVKDA